MNPRFSLGRVAGLSLIGAAALALGACATDLASYDNQLTFQSPQRAAEALASAAESGDVERLEAIFGPDGDEVLSSGDPVADRNNREIFAVAMEQGWSLDRLDGGTRQLIVGNEQWPFPVPLVKDGRGWWFDTEAGVEEVLARRIGRNELAAIGVLRTYVIAQREYASQSHDGRPAGIYAQWIRSDPGRRNGLYWETAGPNDPPSPLGEFAAQAAKEGYGGGDRDGARPYYGYYYRILDRQGPAAPGGAMSYVVNGEMTGGFAMIAAPAAYMNSGVMTFIVGPDGVVYESDLGPDTASVAGAITDFNPDDAWRVVE